MRNIYLVLTLFLILGITLTGCNVPDPIETAPTQAIYAITINRASTPVLVSAYTIDHDMIVFPNGYYNFYNGWHYNNGFYSYQYQSIRIVNIRETTEDWYH